MSVHNNNKIGYALGGGAARGLSHIGVLKVLEERNIFPDIIAGSSIGALIGALYASGAKVGDIEQFALRLDLKRLVFLADLTIPTSGLIGGKRVNSLLKSILGDLTFSQLKCDFACVATDINTGEQVVLREGSLLEAVRASISIPGIFTPVRIKGRYLVDGGLVNEVPVSVCREMGATYVIGVNVIPEPSKMASSSKKSQAKQTTKHTENRKNKGEKKSNAPSNIGDFPILSRFDSVESTIRNIPNNIRGLPGLSRLDDAENAIKSIPSNIKSLPLVSRIDKVDDSVTTFLLYHQPRLHRKMLKSLDWVGLGKLRRLRSKTPSLFHVLSQTLTIAEYWVALENMKHADLAISPDVEGIGFWDFDKAAHAIAVGEEGAARALKNNEPASVG
jgi:predicted acylesterase/phospholipase RssA